MKKHTMEHVLYEMEMFLLAYAFYTDNEIELEKLSGTTSPEVSTRVIQQNFYYECFLIHTRNLIEFFGKKKDDSIVVSSIFFDPDHYYFNDADGKSKEAYGFICKTVSHMSSIRRQQEKTDALKRYLIDLIPEIVNRINSFLTEIFDESKVRASIAEELMDKEIDNLIKAVKSILTSMQKKNT